jgi:V/A-type H+-transporting ATPase subunit E
VPEVFLKGNDMAQQLQELLDKIKEQGINQANLKAQEIEQEAKHKATQIINEAKQEAQQIIQQAQQQTLKHQEASKQALKQVGRDAVLNFRKEVEHILRNTIAKTVTDSLSTEQLAKIIEKAIVAKGESLVITLSTQDEQALKDSLLAKWQQQLKKGFILKTSSDIGRGALISFDGGKSAFDITDEALAEYLASLLDDELKSIMK